MDRRTKNVNIFRDSVELMNGNSRLQQAITESIIKQKLYLEIQEVDVPESKGQDCKTIISLKRSFLEIKTNFGLTITRRLLRTIES